MKVFYEKTIANELCIVDEVNVTIGDTRYPVRNISMVKVNKAKRPAFEFFVFQNFIKKMALLCGAVFLLSAVLYPLAHSAFARNVAIFSFILLLVLVVGLFREPPRITYHSIQFGNSGNDRPVIKLAPLSLAKIKTEALNNPNWENLSEPSYRKIKTFADAVSESIDSFQNQSRSSN